MLSKDAKKRQRFNRLRRDARLRDEIKRLGMQKWRELFELGEQARKVMTPSTTQQRSALAKLKRLQARSRAEPALAFDPVLFRQLHEAIVEELPSALSPPLKGPPP